MNAVSLRMLDKTVLVLVVCPCSVVGRDDWAVGDQNRVEGGDDDPVGRARHDGRLDSLTDEVDIHQKTRSS